MRGARGMVIASGIGSLFESDRVVPTILRGKLPVTGLLSIECFA